MTSRLLLIDGHIDLNGKAVHRGSLVERLTDLEVSLLKHLSAHNGELVSYPTLLEEVWGYHPQTRTRTIAKLVHRLRKRIELEPGNPRHLLTVPGTGLRFLPQPPPPKSDLIGRSSELAALHMRNRDRLTVTGPPGVGKSSLVREYSALHPIETCLISLGGGQQDFLKLMALGLGVELGASTTTAEAIHRFTHAMRNRPVEQLYILDGADRFLTDPALGQLMDAVPQTTFWLTARKTLPRTTPFNVGPLPVDGAIDLFLKHAPSAELNETQVGKLAQALDCLPLAIVFIAARASLLSPKQMLARLDELLNALHSRSDSGLHGALAWSWSALSEPQQQLLGRLSSFNSIFSAEAAAYVASEEEPDHPPSMEILEAFDALRSRHLLRIQHRDGENWLSLYTLVRSFAAQQTPEAYQRGCQRHWQYYGWLSQPILYRGRLASPTQMKRIRQAAPEIQCALERAIQANAPEASALSLASQDTRAFRLPLEAQRRLLDQGIALAQTPAEAAAAHLARAQLSLRHGQKLSILLKDTEKARSLDEHAGTHGLAWRLEALAQRSDPETARRALAQAITLSKGDLHAEGQTALVEGILAEDNGDIQAAIQAYERADEAAAAGDASELRQLACFHLGLLLMGARRFVDARAYCIETVAIADRHGWTRSRISGLGLLGRIALEEDRLDDALELYSAARASWESLREPGKEALVCIEHASLLADMGEIEDARAGLGAIHRDPFFIPLVRAQALSYEAFIDHRLGSYAIARRRLRDAERLIGERYPGIVKQMQLNRAVILADADQPERARALMEDCVTAMAPIDEEKGLWLRLARAHLAASEGRLADARGVLGEGQALLRQLRPTQRKRILGSSSAGGAGWVTTRISSRTLKQTLEILSQAIERRAQPAVRSSSVP